MKKIDQNEYIKSVITQHFPSNKKPTKKGWKLLEEGDKKTFEQLIKEADKAKKVSDKACAILRAVEKADDEIKIMTLYKKIAIQKNADVIISAIEIAYPNSKIAQMISSNASKEYYLNIIRATNEMIRKAKEIKKIAKAWMK
mgnify:CR=1 FL=1